MYHAYIFELKEYKTIGNIIMYRRNLQSNIISDLIKKMKFQHEPIGKKLLYLRSEVDIITLKTYIYIYIKYSTANRIDAINQRMIYP